MNRVTNDLCHRGPYPLTRTLHRAICSVVAESSEKPTMLKLAVFVCLVVLCTAQTPTRPNIPETFISQVT